MFGSSLVWELVTRLSTFKQFGRRLAATDLVHGKLLTFVEAGDGIGSGKFGIEGRKVLKI